MPAEPYFRRFPGSRGFLHAAAEGPDDIALRLILADWLEDQGQQPRAEFIRLQCRLLGLPHWHPERLALEGRESALWREHLEGWLDGLPALPGVRWDEQENFGGGLLEGVVIEGLVIEEGRLGEVFGAADLRRLRVWELGYQMSWDEGPRRWRAARTWPASPPSTCRRTGSGTRERGRWPTAPTSPHSTP